MAEAGLEPGAILLLGGTSDIGLAIVEELLGKQHRPVVLAARSSSPTLDEAKRRVERAGATGVRVLDFDATDFDSHPGLIHEAFRQPVGLAVVAFGQLGDQDTMWRDQPAAVQQAQTNYTGAVSVGVLLGQAMSAQGGGTIIAVSSVAGERVRRSNFVYGSSKAGMDGFYTNLGEALERDGVTVLVVRPGFVTSKMTVGRGKGPLSVTPRQVGRATVRALAAGSRIVRVPASFGPLLAIYRNLPAAVVRRLSF